MVVREWDSPCSHFSEILYIKRKGSGSIGVTAFLSSIFFMFLGGVWESIVWWDLASDSVGHSTKLLATLTQPG